MRHLIWPEWKREKESQTIPHQKVTSRYLSRTTIGTLCTNSGNNCKGTRKIASRWFSSLVSYTADTYFNRQEVSQEIKVKSNESRLLKFYQVKQLKENSTENSAKKNFKEASKLDKKKLKHFDKIKKKRKILKFKELCLLGLALR